MRGAFLAHEIQRLRSATGHRALGGDDELVEAAAEGAADADQFLLLLVAAERRPEYAEMVQAVVDRRDVSWLQPERVKRWDTLRDALLGLEYDTADEGSASHELMPLLWSALVADRVVSLGVPDRDERIERLRSTATAERLRDAFIDEVIGQSMAEDRSARIRVLRAYLIAVRDEIGPELREAADRLTANLDADPDLAQEVIDEVLVLEVVARGSIRRALLNLPSLTTYIGGAIRNTRTRRARDAGSVVVGDRLRDVVFDRTPDPGPGPSDIILEREAYREGLSALTEALGAMSPAMRRDFQAVRIEGMRASEVARSTNRSAAAVSQNIAAADRRVREFFSGRG